MRSASGRKGVLGAAILASLLATAILVPILEGYLARDFKLTDYSWHFGAARKMSEEGRLVPHPLFHLLTIAVKAAVPALDWWMAGLATVLFFYLWLATIIVRLSLARVVMGPLVLRALLAVGLSLGLMILGPVSLMTWSRHNLYLGYIGVNVYHNPTVIILKPLALLLFLWTAHLLSRSGRQEVRRPLALVAALSVLSSLAKPNYGLALVPATILVVAVRWWRGRPTRLASVAWGLIVPTALALAWQYHVTTSDPSLGLQESLRVTLEPFRVMGHRADRLWLRFVLSILFPAAVYVIYLPASRGDRRLGLAWVVFATSLPYAYLLAESGGNAFAGNFLWGSQVALFILFVVSALFVARRASLGLRLRRRRRREGVRLAVCLLAFSLHVASGIAFYRNPLWW